MNIFFPESEDEDDEDEAESKSEEEVISTSPITVLN
jgi:hypothetical protein